jgi:hypothetical protein
VSVRFLDVPLRSSLPQPAVLSERVSFTILKESILLVCIYRCKLCEYVSCLATGYLRALRSVQEQVDALCRKHMMAFKLSGIPKVQT